MKLTTPGYRVAVVGASSLLGRELLAVLEERKFPVAQLVSLAAAAPEPDVPVLDLARLEPDAESGDDLTETAFDPAAAAPVAAEADLVFLAGPPEPSQLEAWTGAAPVIVDLGENRAAQGAVGPVRAPDETLSIPFLEGDPRVGHSRTRLKWYVSPHPAAIVIGTLLLRLGSRSPIRSAVAQVFGPASEIGPRAIEELQKQTLNLLSFQKVPQAVFGAQLAFNVLPRLSRGRRGGSAPYRDGLTDLESRVRSQLRSYLAGRVVLPAMRVIQVPVFYSLTVSLYVETEQPLDPQSVGQALGSRVQLRRISESAPTQIDVAGTNGILVDAVTGDADHPHGLWLWATADNLRLAASNAVEIAEAVSLLNRPLRREGTPKSA
ncbi:MAG TPA: Asd/ArgC dimerization domain-containing protein [Terriglobia bacterium]|nr:Asd/ArgC dimerization domain-containing protein [Terriglobia bacterium]